MLTWSLILLAVAVVAGMLGLGEVTLVTAGLARILFVVSVLAFIAVAIAGLVKRDRARRDGGQRASRARHSRASAPAP